MCHTFFDNACVLIWFLLYMSSICISNNMIWVQIGVQKLYISKTTDFDQYREGQKMFRIKH